MKGIKIGNREIGENRGALIIAEISCNHGQNFSIAVKLIKKAKECGADAVKFQSYTPDTMTIDVNNKYFRIKHPQWGGQTLHQLYQKSYTPPKWFKKLKKICDDLDIMFFSTAFDKSSVDFLEDLGVSLHKVASFELVDIPLIEHVAKTKKPLIMSTGMATKTEIKEALAAAKSSGADNIIIMKCVSSYPADPRQMNLKTIPDMKKTFNVPIGLSDHTLGAEVSIAAVTLGACVIEKHLISSRKVDTPDNFFSMEPQEFKNLVESVRSVELALGKVHYGITNKEKQIRTFRRSLFAVKDIKRGEILTEDNIRSIRPANGLSPKYLKSILGKKIKRDLKRGTPLTKQVVMR